MEAVSFNDTFPDGTIQPAVTDNTFQYVSQKEGRQDVAYWKAKWSDTADGTYKDSRWGIVSPENGTSVDISGQEFLSFDFYFDEDRVPSLNNAWIELEDVNGKKCSVQLSSQNTFGSASLTQRTWENVKVYLDKIPGIDSLDKTQIAKVKFAFRYERNIYLDDIKFLPATTMDVMTGFTVQQSDIPDYGSVEANREAGNKASLQYPEGAVYTVTGENTGEVTYGRIGADGEFSLGDGDTASFSNQFRIGSYLYVEETGVNKEAFTTTWSMYDDGNLVTTYGTGTSVTNPDPLKDLVNVSGYALDDGRTEKVGPNSKLANYEGEKATNDPTIVFRSYENPDNRAIATKLKAVVVNKVKTGSISIKKGTADNSPELGKDTQYTFRITFTNVAGSALESKPITTEVRVKPGETKTITGIPIGTDYVIEEVTPEDGSRLESIILPEGNEYVELDGDKAHGILKPGAETGEATTFVFNNTKRPLIDISVEKKWQDGNGGDISSGIESPIYIQLQRKYTDASGEKPYEVVPINGAEYITIEKGYAGWVYEFTGLEKYQDNACTVPYTYRVVEGTVDGEEFTPVEEGGIIIVDGKEYVVDYQCRETSGSAGDQETTDNITGNDDEEVSQSFEEVIVNKISPKTNLKVVKVDASDNNKKLAGVEFKLEKGTADSTVAAFVPDSRFGNNGSLTMTTGDGENDTTLGEAMVSDLKDGLYRLTETKASSGYSLLKSPLFLKIDRTNGCTIQEGDSNPQEITVDSETNTITLTVSNRLQFELPVTGGYLRFYMIAGGLALAGTALFIYRLQKRRKEVKTPGKK